MTPPVEKNFVVIIIFDFNNTIKVMGPFTYHGARATKKKLSGQSGYSLYIRKMLSTDSITMDYLFKT